MSTPLHAFGITLDSRKRSPFTLALSAGKSSKYYATFNFFSYISIIFGRV
jgi:hypothetical protein